MDSMELSVDGDWRRTILVLGLGGYDSRHRPSDRYLPRYDRRTTHDESSVGFGLCCCESFPAKTGNTTCFHPVDLQIVSTNKSDTLFS